MKVTVLQNQTLIDIALQVYGSVEGVYTLAVENGINVTDDIAEGDQLNYDIANIVNKNTVSYLKNNQIYPATGSSRDIRIFDFTFDISFN